MKVLSWDELEGYAAADGPLAAAVGVFDGLHLGHARLLREVLDRVDLVPGVVTFRENPKKVLRPSSFHGDLFTLDQKLEAFESLGLRLCVLIDFSGDFSKLAGRKFLSLLRVRGDLRFLAVGSNFRCGHHLDTDADAIRGFYEELGVETRLLEPVQVGGRPVSSSRIRKAIVEGRLEEAGGMLGRDYELDLRGARLIRAGETSRVRPAGAQVAPPDGCYEGGISLGGEYLPARLSHEAGEWSFASSLIEERDSPEPRALRLARSVSRE